MVRETFCSNIERCAFLNAVFSSLLLILYLTRHRSPVFQGQEQYWFLLYFKDELHLPVATGSYVVRHICCRLIFCTVWDRYISSLCAWRMHFMRRSQVNTFEASCHLVWWTDFFLMQVDDTFDPQTKQCSCFWTHNANGNLCPTEEIERKVQIPLGRIVFLKRSGRFPCFYHSTECTNWNCSGGSFYEGSQNLSRIFFYKGKWVTVNADGILSNFNSLVRCINCTVASFIFSVVQFYHCMHHNAYNGLCFTVCIIMLLSHSS